MRSLQRMIAVFESFTSDKTILTLQEISERIGLPKSTSFRIVRSLEEAGYLVRLDNHRYCLSFRLTRLAGFVNSTLDIRTIARPALQDLAEATREAVSLQTSVGNQRVCLDAMIASDAPLRSVAQPGQHLPLGKGSVSKVLVAHMPGADLETIFDDIVENSTLTRELWEEEIAKIRQHGYAISHGERQIGLSGISTPIFDVTGAARYCLTVAGPTARLQAEEPYFLKLMKEAAAAVSLQMGGKAGRDG